MKTKLNINIMRSITFFTILCLIALVDCKVFEKTDIRPPKAEITNIYNVTDSTANVDVQVTQQSSAWEMYFYLIVNFSSNATDTSKVQQISLIPKKDAPVGSLNNFYTLKISKLKTKTQYYLHLYFSGYYDIGGPNEWHDFIIGETKSFTTN